MTIKSLLKLAILLPIPSFAAIIGLVDSETGAAVDPDQRYEYKGGGVDTSVVTNIVIEGGGVASLNPVDGLISTDASLARTFVVTLTEDSTLAIPTNARNGQVIKWWIEQGGAGGHSLSLEAGYLLPLGIGELSLSTNAGASDLLIGEWNAGESKVKLTGLMLYGLAPTPPWDATVYTNTPSFLQAVELSGSAVQPDDLEAYINTNTLSFIDLMQYLSYIQTHTTLPDSASVVIPGTAAQYSLTVTQDWTLSLTNGHPRYGFLIMQRGTNTMSSSPGWIVENTNYVPWSVNAHSVLPYGTTNWSILSAGVSE
jgi:hypothetical protein